MPALLLLLPDTPSEAASGWDWVLASDGGQVLGQGRDAATELPAADNVVLVVGARAVNWLRVNLPQTSAKRWRAALSGLLEEQLLDDPDLLHMALPAKPAAGTSSWVAVTALAPLQQAHDALAAANRFVSRIAPLAWPAELEAGATSVAAAARDFQRSTWWQGLGARPAPTGGPQGHFTENAGHVHLEWRDADGVAMLPLNGSYAKSRLSADAMAQASWSAEPAAVASAEAWLGETVPVRARNVHALMALGSGWDLRQFELAPRLHGLQRARQAWHRFLQPDWRATRMGLITLGLLLVLGLNVLALQQHRAQAAKQGTIEALFRSGFPNNPAVQDAAAQLPRELARLRAAAGQPGEGDIDPLLAAAARHWPVGVAPLQALDYQTGLLTLSATDWRDDQMEPFRQALAATGIHATRDGARLVLKAL